MIIGVAIKIGEDVYSLDKPARHHHLIRHIVDVHKVKRPIVGIQGFVDEQNNFYTRKEAFEYVYRTGQVAKTIEEFELYSEDLW